MDKVTPMHKFQWSERTQRLTDSPINWLIKYALENPDTVSLAAGLVDQETFPVAETAQLTQDLCADYDQAKRFMQYGTTGGLPELKQSIIDLFCQSENKTYSFVQPDNVVVTTGSQQLLFLIADSILDPGDIVLVEAPSYFVYMDTLRSFGVEPVTVQFDESGMVPEDLESKIAAIAAEGNLDRLKMVYAVSYCQNPTGVSLADERKEQIVKIVEKWNQQSRILLLEDAAYRDLSFAPEQLSLKSFDHTGELVAYTSTFCKPYAPGFKTGYGILPPDLCEQVILHKGNHDFGSAHWLQGLLWRACETGVYQAQAKKVRDFYQQKMEGMAEAMEEFLPEWAKPIRKPAGGLYFWLDLPLEVQTGPNSALFKQCLEEGVLYVPGEYCFINDPENPQEGTSSMRLSFGVATPKKITIGVKRLGSALRKIK